MSGYPPAIAQTGQLAPAPRRVRGFVGTQTVFDTVRALYVWEWPHYPQYYVPRADVHAELVADDDVHTTLQGESRQCTLRAGGFERPAAARTIVASPIAALRDTVRFDWASLDRWFEEDEEIFVHPRNPYTRVDALRANRPIRIERNGIVLADSRACVMVFETGLPTRYYLDQTDVRFEHLVPSVTRTACPYKGRTTSYWSVTIGSAIVPDIAWSYAFPTLALGPIAGLVAFLNERVDVFVDDAAQPRPTTHLGAS